MQKQTKKYLLIISCSKQKNKITGKIKAWDLYNGVIFKVLKKFDKEVGLPKNLDVLILSAKYGFIKPSDFVEYYDFHITQTSKRDRDNFMSYLEKYIKDSQPDIVFVCLGKHYLSVINQIEKNSFSFKTKFIYANGGIGLKMSQLKKWISDLKNY